MWKLEFFSSDLDLVQSLQAVFGSTHGLTATHRPDRSDRSGLNALFLPFSHAEESGLPVPKPYETIVVPSWSELEGREPALIAVGGIVSREDGALSGKATLLVFESLLRELRRMPQSDDGEVHTFGIVAEHFFYNRDLTLREQAEMLRSCYERTMEIGR